MKHERPRIKSEVVSTKINEVVDEKIMALVVKWRHGEYLFYRATMIMEITRSNREKLKNMKGNHPKNTLRVFYFYCEL